jgi:glucose-1-phosphate thymidylyltransferase
MLSGIREILIITTPHDKDSFERLLGNGSQWGLKLAYKVQENPNGLAEAFIIGKDFIKDSMVALILGDNIFYGQGLEESLLKASRFKSGATIYGYKVSNPKDYGVAKIDNKMNVVSIAEKPKRPLSNIAVTGLYFYDNDVVNIAHKIKPSNRGELEITSINQEYIKNKNLRLELLGRGTAWLDMGTYDNLLSASEFIQTIEKRQGLKIASLEEIAFYKKYISKKEVMKIISNIKGSEYGDYLLSVVK